MRRLLLIARMIVEAVFGLICSVDLFILPGIWNRRDHVALAMGELLGALIVILIGILCFKDVFKMFRLLRNSEISTAR